MMLAWLRAWIDHRPRGPSRGRGPTAVIVLGAALCGWSAGLLAAVATGETLSPAGAVWPMGLTALLLWGVGRRPEGR